MTTLKAKPPTIILKLSCLIMAMLSVPLVSGRAFPQDLKPIYDGRLSLSPAKLSQPLEALMKEKIVPEARNTWHEEEDDRGCIAGPEAVALDIAEGAFTRPQRSQKAVLYRFCTTGHNMALNGIAIIENDRVVSHLVYEGSSDVAIGALPDINGNGRSEIVVASGGTNMGETWRSVSIIELSDTIVLTTFGRMQTYRDNCGAAAKNGKARAEAHRLLVKPGPATTFFRQSYIDKDTCNGEGRWVESGGLERISLEEDKNSYQFVKEPNRSDLLGRDSVGAVGRAVFHSRFPQPLLYTWVEKDKLLYFYLPQLTRYSSESFSENLDIFR